MKSLFVAACFLLLIWFQGSTPFGQAEIRINNKMAPPSGWAVISIQQGTEARPIGSGQGGLRFGNRDSGPLSLSEPLFISDPLIWVENSSGDVTFRIDEFGPDGLSFSFESSVADVGYDNSQPFAFLALRVNPNARVGTQATIRFDPERTVMYDEDGEPYPLTLRSGTFTVGGLSISCISPLTGMVRDGERVTIRGVGFEPRAQVEFDGMDSRARVIDEATIVATAPMDFLADDVEVRVRNRAPGPGRDRPQDSFVGHRFGCFEN